MHVSAACQQGSENTVIIIIVAGQNDQEKNEDAPLMIKEDNSINRHNDGIELSPSGSPESGSPVHV